MARFPTLDVRLVDVPEVKALIAQAHLALGDARTWLSESTPAWVRSEIDTAISATLPKDDSVEREHVLSSECWCQPRIEHVDAAE